MLTLLVVGLGSGPVTALSPCVLPVLPVVLTTSAQQGVPTPRRAVVVVGGLVLSFGAFTPVGGTALRLLGLPQDLLRRLGIGILGIVGLGLARPRVGHLLEAPFAATRTPRLDRDANAFGLGHLTDHRPLPRDLPRRRPPHRHVSPTHPESGGVRRPGWTRRRPAPPS